MRRLREMDVDPDVSVETDGTDEVVEIPIDSDSDD
jgi:hypothetical protein